MADGISIGISTSYNGAGVAAATADMSRLSKAVNLGPVKGTEQWNNRVAALNQRLDAAYQKGVVLKNQWDKFAPAASAGATTAGFAIAAMVASMGVAVKKTYDLGKAGAQIDYTRQKFDRLSNSVGVTGNVFLNQLRTATRGTISDFEAMKQGADLLQLGLAKDSDEAVRLSRVMTALGMDTGEMTLALANQSKRRLDQLGLSLTAFNKIEKELRDKGMSKDQAFKEAFLQTAEQTVSLTGNKADTSIGNYLRFEAQAANLSNYIKESVSQGISPLVGNTANVLQAMNMVRNQEMAWTGNIVDVLFGSGPVLKQGQASDFSSLWANEGRSYGQGRGGTTGAPTAGLSGLQNYTAMAYAYERGFGAQGGAETVQPFQVDYASMLEGGIQITRQTEKFSEATVNLNSALVQEYQNLDQLTKKYGENSEKVTESRQKIEQIKEGISSVGLAAEDMGEQMLSAQLKNIGASDELQVRFAQASGQITEKAANQQIAIQQIASALNDGRITAEQAAGAVGQVMKWDGKTGTMTLDVYINYIVTGQRPTGGGGGGFGGGQGRASGGLLDEPLIKVGEQGWEYAVEDKNGNYMIIPHGASVQMERAGLMASFGLATGGALSASARGVPRSPSHPVYTGGRSRSQSSGATSSEVSQIVEQSVAETAAINSEIMQENMATALTNNPQLGAIAAQVDELKLVNENLTAILAKIMSGGDMTRAMRSANALQA